MWPLRLTCLSTSLTRRRGRDGSGSGFAPGSAPGRPEPPRDASAGPAPSPATEGRRRHARRPGHGRAAEATTSPQADAQPLCLRKPDPAPPGHLKSHSTPTPGEETPNAAPPCRTVQCWPWPPQACRSEASLLSSHARTTEEEETSASLNRREGPPEHRQVRVIGRSPTQTWRSEGDPSPHTNFFILPSYGQGRLNPRRSGACGRK